MNQGLPLAQQIGDLERTVRELRMHVRSLELQLGAAQRSGGGESWWRIFWRKGGGSGRHGTGANPVRENRRRRRDHEYYAQQQLHCA